MSKTIARNRTKLIEKIFAQATAARSYSLESHFHGIDLAPALVLEDFQKTDWAKLKYEVVTRADGTERRQYRIRIHSNHWYEVESPVIP